MRLATTVDQEFDLSIDSLSFQSCACIITVEKNKTNNPPYNYSVGYYCYIYSTRERKKHTENPGLMPW